MKMLEISVSPIDYEVWLNFEEFLQRVEFSRGKMSRNTSRNNSETKLVAGFLAERWIKLMEFLAILFGSKLTSWESMREELLALMTNILVSDLLLQIAPQRMDAVNEDRNGVER